MNPSLPAVLAILCAQAPATPALSPSERLAAFPPPSTVRAVLAHRAELGLDDGQASRLLEIQRQLDRDNVETRNRLAAPAQGKGKAGGADVSAEGRRQHGHREGGRKAGAEPVDRGEALAQALADNDTRVFLRAEPIFREGQWDRALAIGEKYRMGYSDEREALKREAAGQSK